MNRIRQDARGHRGRHFSRPHDPTPLSDFKISQHPLHRGVPTPPRFSVFAVRNVCNALGAIQKPRSQLEGEGVSQKVINTVRL